MALAARRQIPLREDIPSGPSRKARVKRGILWSVFAVNGLLICTILISQPEVIETIQKKAEYASARIKGDIKDPAPVLNFEEDGEATSSSAHSNAAHRLFAKARGFMPKDTVPVRRLGLLSDN